MVTWQSDKRVSTTVSRKMVVLWQNQDLQNPKEDSSEGEEASAAREVCFDVDPRNEGKERGARNKATTADRSDRSGQK